MKKKAQMGEHGEQVLIIFLAVIIVGFIVSAIMMYSARKAGEMAGDIGSVSTERIGVALDVMEINGKQSDGALERILVSLKLNHGASAMKYEDFGIALFYANDTDFYEYTNHTGNLCDNLVPGTFHVKAILEGDKFIPGFIFGEDAIELCLEPFVHFGENEELAIRVLPKDGTKTNIEFITPAFVRSGSFIRLYPY